MFPSHDQISCNVIIGDKALELAQDALGNIALGNLSMGVGEDYTNNVALGTRSLAGNAGSTGMDDNVAIEKC